MEAIPAEHDVSGDYTKLLMEFLVETMPSDHIEELLRRAGETRCLDELADAGQEVARRRRIEQSQRDVSPVGDAPLPLPCRGLLESSRDWSEPVGPLVTGQGVGRARSGWRSSGRRPTSPG